VMQDRPEKLPGPFAWSPTSAGDAIGSG
jgi:hypothetical protein